MIRKLLVAVLLLVVLVLVVVDRLAERVAGSLLANQLTSQLGERPTVDVHGFPFLTQVARGRYDNIQVRAAEVDHNGLTLDSFSSSLAGVQVPLSNALAGNVDAVPVQRLTATGVVPYTEFERLAGRDLTLVADPQGVLVTGTFRVLGQSISASTVSRLTLDNGTLRLQAGELKVGGVVAGGAIGRALSGQLDLTLHLPALPYGATLTSVSTGPTGVTVSGAATDVVLRR